MWEAQYFIHFCDHSLNFSTVQQSSVKASFFFRLLCSAQSETESRGETGEVQITLFNLETPFPQLQEMSPVEPLHMFLYEEGWITNSLTSLSQIKDLQTSNNWHLCARSSEKRPSVNKRIWEDIIFA